MAIELANLNVFSRRTVQDPDTGWVYEADPYRNGQLRLAEFPRQNLYALYDASVGCTVSQWDDQSGNGYHLLQATANNQGTIVTDFNGRGDDLMQLGPNGTHVENMLTSSYGTINTQSAALYFVGQLNSDICKAGVVSGANPETSATMTYGLLKTSAPAIRFATQSDLDFANPDKLDVWGGTTTDYTTFARAEIINDEKSIVDTTANAASLNSPIVVTARAAGSAYVQTALMAIYETKHTPKQVRDITNLLARRFLGEI